MAPPRKHLDDYIATIKLVGSWWCWKLPHKLDSDGYVRLNMLGKKHRAHRAIYEYLIGPISHDLVPDHLCRNTWCVNPNHIEPVTQRENALRGNGICGRNARKMHCPQGHPYSKENTHYYKTYRACRICGREKVRRHRIKTLNKGS